LGGEFQRLAAGGFLFEGAYVADAQGRDVWHYGLFWAFVGEGKDEQYALARSGLWAASPDSSPCDRSAGLTLLIDHAVTSMQFQADRVVFTAREVPGYFQYVQYKPPMQVHSSGYRLQAEDGSFIDACCS
jgi:hypothetical protein